MARKGNQGPVLATDPGVSVPCLEDTMHHIQARRAFIGDQDNVRFFRLTGVTPGDPVATIELTPHSGGTAETWQVADGPRLTGVLGRDDLTRLLGSPFVAANAGKRTLAIATGPAAPPRRLGISGVFDLANATLIPLRDSQPLWWVFDAHQMAVAPDPG